MLLSGLFSECLASSLAIKWSMVTQPARSVGNAQSIGTYNAGCIRGAVSVPVNGIGYQMMRLSRKRSFGHPDLKQFIEELGQTTANQNLGTLLIGDLGQPRGGPTLSGHRSHQSGLDVDIWFLLSKQAASRTLAFNERETWVAPSVLAANSDAIDYRQWSLANVKVLEAAARMPEVDRIFVNPSVKRELCTRSMPHDWLKKIRPWWKHDDHFHVRLKCPKDNKYCQGQEPLPPGDGCDAGLAWWFTEEAKHPIPPKIPPKPLVLPPLCDSVLQE
ncbi:MAG: penicillin-insensitive murein endopeptidase [Methylococcales bacterium]|nr:penicillin-insensitive murein endopeptidase [Methylococcales bacterium]MDD5631142.1 penicillin-insensitive murein endopeptidase [Methylococcales bacterium]